jgi:hypothetical protein
VKTETFKFKTEDALQLTAEVTGRPFKPRVWDEIVGQRHYTEAPSMITSGVARLFDRDDIAALVLFDHLRRRDRTIQAAARIASAFRKQLRKTSEDVESLWIVSTKMGEPRRIVATKPVGEFQCDEVLIGDLRRRVSEVVAKRIGRQ